MGRKLKNEYWLICPLMESRSTPNRLRSLTSCALTLSARCRPRKFTKCSFAHFLDLPFWTFFQFEREFVTTIRYLYKLRVDIEHRQVVAFFHCEFSLDHILKLKKITRWIFHSFIRKQVKVYIQVKTKSKFYFAWFWGRIFNPKICYL